MSGRRVCVLLVALLAAMFSTGCPTGFVEEAGRSSLSSFITSIVTTAVDGTINP